MHPCRGTLDEVVQIAIDAGDEILNVYGGDFAVHTKPDGSQLTDADRRADALIRARLEKLTPTIPLLSEESGGAPFAERSKWRRYWLVDPLDGTREFVARSGHFTVNIALIENRRAVFGVVHAPVGRVSYYADGNRAHKKIGARESQPIRTRKLDNHLITMLVSRAHKSRRVEAYRARLAPTFGAIKTRGIGSSLKMCLLAEGEADVYPRLAPTFEWDTAAAQCVLESAGGAVFSITGAPLVYNKPKLDNPWFIACGDDRFDWCAAAVNLE